jgi:hypothetical protein
MITFLGTAAANAFPEAFRKCRNCAQARTLGGPILRKRSAALINNDHLDLSHLLSRSPAYGVFGAPVLDFYASREILARAAETFERDVGVHGLLSFEAEKHLKLQDPPDPAVGTFTVGQYSVMAFPANHAPGMGAMLYAIEDAGCTVFYGNGYSHAVRTDVAGLPAAPDALRCCNPGSHLWSRTPW